MEFRTKNKTLEQIKCKDCDMRKDMMSTLNKCVSEYSEINALD